MTHIRSSILAILWLICGGSAHASADTISSERVGTVNYSVPKGQPRDIVILFADPAAGPTLDATQKLVDAGNVVAIINPVLYQVALSSDKGDCLWISSDIEILNHALQRKLNFPEFRVPVLASIGPAGGALVYVLLSEAPSYSFAGGASTDLAPTVLPKLKFCGEFKVLHLESGDNFEPHDLTLSWKIESAPRAEQETAEWTENMEKAEVVADDMKKSSGDRLAGLVKPLVDAALKKDPNSLEDLPLIELPQLKPAPYMAIIYSGDGGWRDLDRTLGQLISAAGVPVVGVDSLLYFWKPKRPEVVAHDLDRIMDHYATAWKTNKFVLIGFSFGADIMPFAYNRLSDENKARVIEMALLGISHNAAFEISAEEYFSSDATDETRAIEPELMQIPAGLVKCFYGVDEANDSACNTPTGQRFEVIKTAGGHHFGDDYDALARQIMMGANKRLNKPAAKN